MAVRFRRFAGYFWVPERGQFREVDDVKTRCFALSAVIAEVRKELAGLEDELLDAAQAGLDEGHTADAVARWCRLSRPTMLYRLNRRRGILRKRDVDRLDARIRRLADRVAA
jgi:hypothetical protein